MNIIIGVIIWVILACILVGVASQIGNPYNLDNIPEKHDKYHTGWLTFITLPLLIINMVTSMLIYICSYCILKIISWKEK